MEELLEVDWEALEILTGTPFGLIALFGLLTGTQRGRPRNLTLHSFVLSLSHVYSRVSATLAPHSPNSVFHSHIDFLRLLYGSSPSC